MDKAANKTTVVGGLGFCPVLFLVFLVLKLTGVIGWSWWWITAPLWMPWFLVIVVLITLACLLIWDESKK